VDESSQDERVHLPRLSLAYRGGALALAWQVWEQNARLADGAYWVAVTSYGTRRQRRSPPICP